ncbi:hypothetical protein J2T13_001458 [Paenibacillus sp. DS2015]|uniref:hypothetical protein n=1 Tax=Paenibacillus sp. DS2015 TaxID=3373917 RepID=UPI003D19E5E8
MPNMMSYTLEREELFYLCVLSGANVLFGIEDPSIRLSQKEIRTKWSEVSTQLVGKRILSIGENQEPYIDQAYARLVTTLSFPDRVFISLKEDNEQVDVEFIHMKNDVCTQLKGEEHYEIQVTGNREDCLSLLYEEFILRDCEREVQLTIPSVWMDDVLALAESGKLRDAVKLLEHYGLNDEEGEHLLRALFIQGDTRVLAGYGIHEESPSETLFTCVATEKGTWVMCMKRGSECVTLFRRHPPIALEYIMNF